MSFAVAIIKLNVAVAVMKVIVVFSCNRFFSWRDKKNTNTFWLEKQQQQQQQQQKKTLSGAVYICFGVLYPFIRIIVI